MPSIFFRIPLPIGTFQQLSLFVSHSTKKNATPNNQENTTETAEFDLVLIRMTLNDDRWLPFPYMLNWDDRVSIMEGCAVCSKFFFGFNLKSLYFFLRHLDAI